MAELAYQRKKRLRGKNRKLRISMVYDPLNLRQADIEACATCPYYPQCFLLTMCKIDIGCTPEYQQEHLHNMMEGMRNEYEHYLNNLNNENHYPDNIAD